jgi:hypothetical protein
MARIAKQNKVKKAQSPKRDQDGTPQSKPSSLMERLKQIGTNGSPQDGPMKPA